MAEFVYDEVQTVAPGKAALLNDSIPCRKGYVLHNNGSGIVTLRGIVNGPSCGCATRHATYDVSFEADIAVPAGGTAVAISVGIAQSGEIIPVTVATVTPTVAGAFFHVSGRKTIQVSQGCCPTVSIDNNSTQDIQIQHLNVPVVRTA